MAKPPKAKDPENTARRKLADAQARLHAAQERRTGVVSDGDMELERVRRRVNQRIDKATKVVERRAGKVARAEERLLTLQRRQAEARSAEKASKPVKVKKSRTPASVDTEVSPSTSPEAAAEQLEAMEVTPPASADSALESVGRSTVSADAAADHLSNLAESAADDHSADAIVVPGEPAANADVASHDRYAQRLLVLLRDEFSPNGATFTEWLAVAGMSKRTFLRARKALIDSGLAERRGSGQGARYFAMPVS